MHLSKLFTTGGRRRREAPFPALAVDKARYEAERAGGSSISSILLTACRSESKRRERDLGRAAQAEGDMRIGRTAGSLRT